MRRLRTASSARLLALLAVLVVAVTGAGIAQAALSGAAKPAPKPLDRAIFDSLNGPEVEGISAHVEFTNDLLPAGSLPDGTASPALTGAGGRLWLARDGRVRLELQSSAGDAQLVADGKRFLFYDAGSKTAITGALPADRKPAPAADPVTLDGVRAGLAELAKSWQLSGAAPGTTADRPSYTVRIAPKDDGGLLGAAEVAWDAAHGVPLRAAIYAQGSRDPVLELEATDISYGPIDAGKLSTKPPAGAQVTELDPPVAHDPAGTPTRVSGVEDVERAVGFPLAAPKRLAGLPRRSVSLVDFGGDPGALIAYGEGIGRILVFEQRSAAPAAPDLRLPEVNIDGATGYELATALGTVVTFQEHGIGYVVAGSVPPLVAENAARELK